MWTPLTIENTTEKKLLAEFPQDEIGKLLYGDYLNTKKNLCEHILEEIKVRLPDHTDHGERHVKDVMSNAAKLLGNKIESMDGLNLYCLLMAILFHDTGNYYDRKNHQKNISEIYGFARPKAKGLNFRMEQMLIMSIVKAHCGFADDKTKNTLKFVDQTSLHDLKQTINTRELAAIVRFADELAEGSHRTSYFKFEKGEYDQGSKIFHQYAKITNLTIDPQLERIALTYNIDVDKTGTGDDLEELIAFAFERIIKLDQERRYTKHYCDLLQKFKKTTVSFNFWTGQRRLELGLSTLTLDDLIIPGESNKTVTLYNPDYKVSNIIQKVKCAITVEPEEQTYSVNKEPDFFSKFIKFFTTKTAQ